MSEQEHEQQKTDEEQEETMKDLEVPDDESKDVKGGIGSKLDTKY